MRSSAGNVALRPSRSYPACLQLRSDCRFRNTAFMSMFDKKKSTIPLEDCTADYEDCLPQDVLGTAFMSIFDKKKSTMQLADCIAGIEDCLPQDVLGSAFLSIFEKKKSTMQLEDCIADYEDCLPQDVHGTAFMPMFDKKKSTMQLADYEDCLPQDVLGLEVGPEKHLLIADKFDEIKFWGESNEDCWEEVAPRNNLTDSVTEVPGKYSRRKVASCKTLRLGIDPRDDCSKEMSMCKLLRLRTDPRDDCSKEMSTRKSPRLGTNPRKDCRGDNATRKTLRLGNDPIEDCRGDNATRKTLRLGTDPREDCSGDNATRKSLRLGTDPREDCSGDNATLKSLRLGTDPREDCSGDNATHKPLRLGTDPREDSRGDNILWKIPRPADKPVTPRAPRDEPCSTSGVTTIYPSAKSNGADCDSTPRSKFQHSHFIHKNSTFARIDRCVNQVRIVVGLALAFFWFAAFVMGIIEWYLQSPEETTTMIIIRQIKTASNLISELMNRKQEETLMQGFCRQITTKFPGRRCKLWNPQRSYRYTHIL